MVRLFGQLADVNPSAGTLTIRGVHETRTFEVENKQRLGELKVGEGVIATIRNTVTGEETAR